MDDPNGLLSPEEDFQLVVRKSGVTQLFPALHYGSRVERKDPLSLLVMMEGVHSSVHCCLCVVEAVFLLTTSRNKEQIKTDSDLIYLNPNICLSWFFKNLQILQKCGSCKLIILQQMKENLHFFNQM